MIMIASFFWPLWVICLSGLKLIFSQFIYAEEANLAYREAIQKYAKEEQRVWEDLRHGIFVGTENFVKKIKER